MIAPRNRRPGYRRPCTRLNPDEVARLVAMRDGGVTWKEIGRVVGKQDHACKSIYDKAKATPAKPAT